MNIVIVGHVDHGKSTIIGRLLADTDSLPEGKLQAVKDNCARNAKPFEYAFLLDALQDEQDQGITIDAARVFFKSEKRHYIIIDAPGHIEFLKNMITGASRAESALLVIDAAEGVQENSRRHGYMLAMLGIHQVAVLVNKMDLVDYDQKTFEKIRDEYTQFLSGIGVTATTFLPVSGREGDNVASTSQKMSWFQSDHGRTVLEVLDGFEKEAAPVEKPFRLPVQGVYKFTANGDNRRIIAGTVEAGSLTVGDEVVFYPSGKKSRVKTFEQFNGTSPSVIQAGDAAGFTLEEQIYITRGEIAAKVGEVEPVVSGKLNVSLFWLAHKPLAVGREFSFKIGTIKVPARVEKILRTIDASSLDARQTKQQIERHDVAECEIHLKKAIAFDPTTVMAGTSRFVLVDDYEIRGGGIIREAVVDEQENVRKQVMRRNQAWVYSEIHPDERAERYNQKAALVLITGTEATGKKTLARALEKRLFKEGKFVYFMGIGNLLYGVDADIKEHGKDRTELRREHLRRMAEVSHLLLDAGAILIITARNLTGDDLALIRTGLNGIPTRVVWLGDATPDKDLEPHLSLAAFPDADSVVPEIKRMLQEAGVIFRV
ncbi:MAG: adenylyl-sulfate kinase [Candidatus Marinimicrobia bacterium]|nr:adenylyl-sulfate kinase [Candidatus Neomarinimicrobiota bacterium]